VGIIRYCGILLMRSKEFFGMHQFNRFINTENCYESYIGNWAFYTQTLHLCITALCFCMIYMTAGVRRITWWVEQQNIKIFMRIYEDSTILMENCSYTTATCVNYILS